MVPLSWFHHLHPHVQLVHIYHVASPLLPLFAVPFQAPVRGKGNIGTVSRFPFP
jgi:hypothetical protein